MRALSAWVDAHETLVARTLAFIMTFLMMFLILQAASANDVSGPRPPYTDKVLVFSRNANNDWVARTGRIKAFANLIPVICFELPKKVSVQCFYVNDKGEASLEDMELAGEKNT